MPAVPRLLAVTLAALASSGCVSGAMATSPAFWERCDEDGDCVLWMAGAMTADIAAATVAAAIAAATSDDGDDADEEDDLADEAGDGPPPSAPARRDEPTSLARDAARERYAPRLEQRDPRAYPEWP